MKNKKKTTSRLSGKQKITHKKHDRIKKNYTKMYKC